MKILLNAKVEDRFKVLVQELCNKLDIVIIAMEYDKNHVHLFLHALSTPSPADIMAKIKGVTLNRLKDEFSHLVHLLSLWARRSYFISTAGNVTIQHYVESQKMRG